MLATAQDVRVLDPGIAVDIPFTPGGADDKAVAERLRTALQDLPVDVVVQPAAARRKRLFVADMDSTMIGQECIDELADYVGLKAHVAAITERAMRGEIAFEPALRERVALLKGLPVAAVDEVIAKRITLTPGGRTLVATMRRNGALRRASSPAASRCSPSRVAAMIGFDEQRGNTLLVEDGKLCGPRAEPILGREAKLATLIELRDRLGLSPARNARGRRRRERSRDDRGRRSRRRLSRQAEGRRSRARAHRPRRPHGAALPARLRARRIRRVEPADDNTPIASA